MELVRLLAALGKLPILVETLIEALVVGRQRRRVLLLQVRASVLQEKRLTIVSDPEVTGIWSTSEFQLGTVLREVNISGMKCYNGEKKVEQT